MARRTRDLGDSLGTFEVAFTAAFAMLAPANRARHLAALWRLDVGIREKTLWRLLYETAARASEILTLDIADLDRPGKRARVISKGGDTDWVYYQTGTALLLPRLLAARTRGPVFLAERAPTRATPTLDLCPDTGRARLSYRRAAELFAHATTPLATAAGQSTGWTMHQLRHSALTHDAESGTNTPMLLARSRHASMRSLERYARPGPEALARLSRRSDRPRRPTTQPVETHPQRPSHPTVVLASEIRRRLAQRPDGRLRRGWGSVLHVARRTGPEPTS